LNVSGKAEQRTYAPSIFLVHSNDLEFAWPPVVIAEIYRPKWVAN